MSPTPLTAESTPGPRILRRGRRCLVWGLLTMGAAAAVTISGCASTLDLSALKPGSKLDKRESIDGIMGPTERKLKQDAWERQKRELTAGRSPEEKAVFAEYAAAQKLFDAGRYKEAEKSFTSLARSRQTQGMNWLQQVGHNFASAAGTATDSMYGQYGDPIEEDSLYMIAEAQFAQRDFPTAQDSYDRLLEKYPSSRHLDDVTHRMFDIAHSWMSFPLPDEKGDVQMASGELLKTNPRVGQKGFKKPSFFNVTDGSRPVFDTSGRALQALESIWLHDANGPLADDALMLTANYHLQTGNYVEAARVYKLLREQYPDSPHFKDAYVLESHVRLAAYEGPAYDSRGLEDAKELKQSARELFPDLTDQQRAMLDKELSNIEIAEVRREWHQVEFFKSKGDDTAVALHCNKILNRYPDSRFAEPARRELEAIRERSRKGRGWSLFPNNSGDPNSPVLKGIVAPPINPAPKSPANPSGVGRARVATPVPSQTPKANNEPGYLRRFLRRTETDPKLKPVDPDAAP